MLLLFSNSQQQSEYTASAVTFDGSNDYVRRSTPLSVIDGSLMVLSLWHRIDASKDGVTSTIYSLGDDLSPSRLSVVKTNTNLISIAARGVGAQSLSFSSASSYTSASGWLHIMAAVDTNAPAGSKLAQLVINGVNDLGSVTDANSAFDVHFAADISSVGSNNNVTPGALCGGDMADVWIAVNQYVDPTNSTVYSKFASAGKPVYLGTNGEMPTGIAPAIFFSGNNAAFGVTNYGTGGAHTVFGALDNAVGIVGY